MFSLNLYRLASVWHCLGMSHACVNCKKMRSVHCGEGETCNEDWRNRAAVQVVEHPQEYAMHCSQFLALELCGKGWKPPDIPCAQAA